MWNFVLALFKAGGVSRVGLVACALAAAGAAGAYGGWRFAHADTLAAQLECERYRAEVARQTSEALAALAARFQDAERRYEAERDRKQQVRERVTTEVRYEIRELPVRDCPLTADARRLLVRAHCAAAGDRPDPDPECVPAPVPANPASAKGGK